MRNVNPRGLWISPNLSCFLACRTPAVANMDSTSSATIVASESETYSSYLTCNTQGVGESNGTKCDRWVDVDFCRPEERHKYLMFPDR